MVRLSDLASFMRKCWCTVIKNYEHAYAYMSYIY